MTFRQFEALYWIARLGSFHAAARHLKTSQPAISTRIRELEKELGIALFDRSERKVRPTAKGHELLHYAAQVIGIASEIQQRVGTREALSGRVRLGITNIPALTWLPSLLRRLERGYPGITVEFAVAASETLHDNLQQGTLDVAVLAGPPSSSQLHMESVGQVPMAWFASPALQLPIDPLTAADLALWPVITDSTGAILHTLAMTWFRAEGVEPSRHHGCSSLPTRMQLAVEGVGIAVLPPSAVGRELATGVLRLVPTVRSLPTLEYFIAYADFSRSPAGRIVADLVKQLISEKPDLQAYYSAVDASQSRSKRTGHTDFNIGADPDNLSSGASPRYFDKPS